MLPNELQQIIRYGISQLSALNGQSDFEKICLYFSRARIQLNILPATGPVQAGGDQGRDFETFHSYIKGSHLNNSTFIGMFSKYPVAFACSLEKNPTKKNGKIHSDVQTITKSGSVVERIYFFSGEDIPVAKRHKCQTELKKEFNTEIEIIDAQAISLHLCDSDIFWIAVQYLKIPMESYPKPIEKNWYSKLLDEYKSRETDPTTFQEFAEIKSAVRFIYKDEKLKSDLVFWIPKLDAYINNQSLSQTLGRKAIYEKFVASLMGLNNISGQESNIEKYFSNFEKFTSVSEIEDAQILLSFCRSSKRVIGNNLQESFLNEVGNKLEKLILQRFGETDNNDTKCFLIEIHAHFTLHKQTKKEEFSLNIQSFIKTLSEILPFLKNSYFYPIERLANRINEFIDTFLELPIKVNLSGLEKLASQVDITISEKGGKALVAEKLKDRAIIYQKKNELFKSINCLHQAKIGWFNEETLKGTILSCLLLAESYSKLNLFYAAKYYAFVGAFLAIEAKDTKLSTYFIRGLGIASDCDYQSGSWLNYLDLCEFLIITNYQITKDFDLYAGDDNYRILYYPAVIYFSASLLLPETVGFLNFKLSKWKFIHDDIKEIVEKLKDKVGLSAESLMNLLGESIKDKVFNDLGSLRKIEFNVLGCIWKFVFKNDYVTNSLAEEFISIFQVTLADFNDVDLHLLPSSILIEITITNDEVELERLPSNNEGQWKVKLCEYRGETLKDLNDYEMNHFAFVQTIIFDSSVLPKDEFFTIVDGKMENNCLLNKVTFGRPYAELYEKFISEDNYIHSYREIYTNNIYPLNYISAPNLYLKWKKNLSTKYNREESLKAINNRIRNATFPIEITLPLLKKSANFKIIVTSLREKGWLDWQIQNCIATMVVNFKCQIKQNGQSLEQLQKIYQEFFFKKESEWYIQIPESIFTKEALEQELTTLLPATLLRFFQLEFHSETPNGNAIIELLSYKFNYLKDGKEFTIFD